MQYVVIAGSIGITLFWRPTKGVALVRVSFTRMYKGISLRCTTGELPIGGSLYTVHISVWPKNKVFLIFSVLASKGSVYDGVVDTFLV